MTPSQAALFTHPEGDARRPRAARVEDTIQRLGRLAGRATGAPLAFVVTRQPLDPAMLECHAWPADAAASPLDDPALEALCRGVLETGEPVCLGDLRARAATDEVALRGRGVRALLGCAFPPGADGGVFVADFDPREWTAEDVEALEDVATTAAAELQRRRLVWRGGETEQLLRLQAEYLQQLFESAPEAVALLDGGDRVVRVNAAFTRLFGYTQSEAQGRPINEMIAPGELRLEADLLDRRAAGAEDEAVECIRCHRDGHSVHVARLPIPVRVDGRRVATYAVYRDLSVQREAAEALRKKEERFRSLIEHSTDVILILNAGGTVEYASPSIERRLGLEAIGMVGRSIFSLVHPDDAPAAVEVFTEVVRGADMPEPRTCRVAHRDGSWRTLEVHARNLLADPAIAGVVLNARDVTSEHVATHTQNRLNAFLEATPDFVAIFDPHGRALSVNRAFRDAVGLGDSDDLSRVTIPDLYPRAATDLILHDGIPAATQHGVWTGEMELHDREGRVTPISQLIIAHKSGTGSVEFLSTLARDISEQKRAEAALRRSEQHFRSLIENALDIIMVLDAEGQVGFASPSVERVLGYAPDELAGEPWSTLVHPDDVAAVLSVLARVARTPGLSESVEARCRHRDGSWRVLESVTENLLADPAVAGIVVNSRDITERKAAEEALIESREQLMQSQKMEAVGRLAGGVAHDFNNLLTAIKGFTELLLLDLDDMDPRRPFVSEIQGAANRAASLTRQLLAFSRKQVLQPRVLDLNASVIDIEKMLRRLIGEDVLLETVVASEPVRIKADPGQIEQVMLNLVVNARDAMPDGGRLTVATSCEQVREEQIPRDSDAVAGPFAVLTVSDTGLGMDEATRAHIFEPFFTTKGQGKGTGLGLSTVYGIVQQSGGFVEVDSVPGVGSSFRIFLPRVEQAVSEARPRRSQFAPLSGSETVLLVEDEVAVRVLVRRVLDRAGYRVIEAVNGVEALELTASLQEPIHLVLTDVVMPGMSGRQLADRLCARIPDLRVLYMSGYTDDAVVHHGVLDEGVFYLEKPFTPDVLLRRIREVIDSPGEL